MRYLAKSEDGRTVGEGRTIITAVNRAKKRGGAYVVDDKTGAIQWRKPEAALDIDADPPRTINLDGKFSKAILAIRAAHNSIKKAKDSEDGGNDEEHDAANILCDELNALYAVIGIKEI